MSAAPEPEVPLPDRGPVTAGVAGIAAGWFLALLASLFLVNGYRGFASGWRPDPLAPAELAVEVLATAIGSFWGAAFAARLTNVSAAGAAALGAAVAFVHGLFFVAWGVPGWFWPAILSGAMAAAAAGARVFRTALAPREPAPPISAGFVEGTGQARALRVTEMLLTLGAVYVVIGLHALDAARALLGLAVALTGTAGQWALIRCPRCQRRVVTSVGLALGIPRGVRSLAACPHCAYAP